MTFWCLVFHLDGQQLVPPQSIAGHQISNHISFSSLNGPDHQGIYKYVRTHPNYYNCQTNHFLCFPILVACHFPKILSEKNHFLVIQSQSTFLHQILCKTDGSYGH
ncbi:hypothetical protein PanWU01x14_121380 [Parasponia andersonii]|uniref:Uncharacterized protein n=1 Tax=Parasponia andersonii TaxID=3476 RepID=A0A2P5CVF2_PARAD|nr:hypothetical protein PanWU01x14_121380 [Parasponia andersonii]